MPTLEARSLQLFILLLGSLQNPLIVFAPDVVEHTNMIDKTSILDTPSHYLDAML